MGAASLLAALVLVPDSSASGYTVHGCRWPNGPGVDTIKANYIYSSASPYYIAAVNSRSAWNSAQSKISFTAVNSGQRVTMYETNLGSIGRSGLSSWSCSGGNFVAPVTSRWNQFYTDTYDDTAKKQVMVHELGHALGLDHSGSLCGTAAIMYTDDYRYFTCNWSTPKSDDATGINNLYP